MQLGYTFINLELVKDLFDEAELAGRTLSSTQSMEVMGTGLHLLLERAKNAMLVVELNGPKEQVEDLMKNIETYLCSKGWTNMEAED